MNLIKVEEFKLKMKSDSRLSSEVLIWFPNSGLVNEVGTD